MGVQESRVGLYRISTFIMHLFLMVMKKKTKYVKYTSSFSKNKLWDKIKKL